MAKWFLYLFASFNWYSRYVLSWALGNTLYMSFCLRARQAVLATQPVSFIFNSDRSSQFTGQLSEQDLLAVDGFISRDDRN